MTDFYPLYPAVLRQLDNIHSTKKSEFDTKYT